MESGRKWGKIWEDFRESSVKSILYFRDIIETFRRDFENKNLRITRHKIFRIILENYRNSKEIKVRLEGTQTSTYLEICRHTVRNILKIL